MTVTMTAMPVRRKVSLPGQFITTSCSYLTTWSSLDFRYLVLFLDPGPINAFLCQDLAAMLKLRWFIWHCHIEILVVIYVDVDANIDFDNIADNLSGEKRKGLPRTEEWSREETKVRDLKRGCVTLWQKFLKLILEWLKTDSIKAGPVWVLR